MLIVYDLDKTSLYCPIASMLDRFIPRNKKLKILYYKLYPFVHTLEDKLGLLKINQSMTSRFQRYQEYPEIKQIVVTARHFTKETIKHVLQCFPTGEDLPVVCCAQGITDRLKAEVINDLPFVEPGEEIIMYDDNFRELANMRKYFKGHFTGVQVLFNGREEKILNYVY